MKILFTLFLLTLSTIAADLPYSSTKPDTTDSDRDVLRKQALAIHLLQTNGISLSDTTITTETNLSIGLVSALPDGMGTNALLVTSGPGGANNSGPLAVLPLVLNSTADGLNKWDSSIIINTAQYADLTNRLQAIETAIGAPKTNSLAVDSSIPVVGQQGTYNVQVNRDTTATGIPAGEILAPEIRWQNVAISATNSITLHNFKFWSPGSIGATMWTNYFRLWICSAPVTWGETNAVWAPVETELGTNLIGVIDTMDTTQGRWIPGASGTNLFWQSYGLSLLLKPATNDLFLYFQSCNNDITNVLPARATFDYFHN